MSASFIRYGIGQESQINLSSDGTTLDCGALKIGKAIVFLEPFEPFSATLIADSPTFLSVILFTEPDLRGLNNPRACLNFLLFHTLKKPSAGGYSPKSSV